MERLQKKSLESPQRRNFDPAPIVVFREPPVGLANRIDDPRSGPIAQSDLFAPCR